MAPTKLAPGWSTKFESEKSMAFFLREEVRSGHAAYTVYLLNKDTLELFHVMDFPDTHPNLGECEYIACVYHRGKLYMVGDRGASDVHVCDLLDEQPYVWKRGPSMRSVKPDPHLVAYNGMIFVLSNQPAERDVNPMYTFEVWDTTTGCWVALPDPPLKDFNLTSGLYQVVSHTILDGLIYFVFDYTDSTEVVVERVGIATRYRPRFRSTRVEAFDPNLRQWIPSSSTINVASDDDENGIDYDNYNYEHEESHDMLSLYLDFSARRHEGGVKVMEFFEGDPSLRMFLIDPSGGMALTPCFYTCDFSTFNPKDMLKAVRDFSPPCLSDLKSNDYLDWFQELVRPHLSSVAGLASLVHFLKHQPNRDGHCFVLPSSYDHNCWTFCVVAFTKYGDGWSCVIAKFRLKMLNSFRATAEDVEMRVEKIPNTSHFHQLFSRIP